MNPNTFGSIELNPAKTEESATNNSQIPSNEQIVIDLDEAGFEEALNRSKRVPIVIDLWAPWCAPCRQLGPILEQVVKEYGGKIQLAKVNVDENPVVSQAFQVQGIPAVFALLEGRAMPLFTGAAPLAQVRAVIEKLSQLAKERNITGSLAGNEAEILPEAPLDPLLQEAQEAAKKSQWATAKESYEHYLRKNPSERKNIEGKLALVSLRQRLEAITTDSGELNDLVQHADREKVTNVSVQLQAADAQIYLGFAEQAFSRVLTVLASVTGEEKELVRERIVELFALVGEDNPATKTARRKLATLLF